MRKFCAIIGFTITICAYPALADIEIIVPPIDAVRGAKEKITTYTDQLSALHKAADSAVQAAEKGINNVNGLAQTVTNPAGVIEGVVKTTTTSALGSVSNLLDGTSGEDEVIEAVQNTYTPTYNMPLPEVRKHYDELNKKAGEDLARLFARSIILRQELMAEETPEEKFETIKEAQAASTALIIKSAQRWNKILEIQAYTDEFSGSKQMQIFRLDEEETDNENK